MRKGLIFVLGFVLLACIMVTLLPFNKKEAPPPPPPQPTEQLVVLNNGNRLTGEIISENEDFLILEIPETGQVRLERSEIAEISVPRAKDYRDLVFLRNGNQIFGAVEEAGDGVRIDIPGTGQLEFKRGDIKRIVELDAQSAAQLEQDYRERAEGISESYTFNYFSESDFLDDPEAEILRAFEERQKDIESRLQKSNSLAMQTRLNSLFGGDRGNGGGAGSGSGLQGKFFGFLAGLGGWLYLLGLLLGVYYAVCLKTIAQKTGTDEDWMAWVPIAHLYLACRCGNRPGYWFILYAIPFVNMLIDVIVWLGICESRGKPKAMAAMALFPVLNWIMAGYVAFSD